MTEAVIKDVSETAFWIAHLRAVESERSDALFRDPLARRLAGERGRQIATSMPQAHMIKWTVAVRTRVIDEFLLAAIAGGVDTVLNLGAGLDARPYWMNLPAALRWIEADYPHLVEYKEGVLAGEAPRCHVERVKIDLADRAARRKLLAGVDAGAARVLVLTEGVVPYLPEEQVASLADDLRAMSHVRFWIADYVSPQVMKWRRDNGVEKRMPNARFKFEPADWFRFFREHGWQSRDVRYLLEAGEKLGRPLPLPKLARLVSKILLPLMPRGRVEAMRRFAAYVLMEPC